jgi:hypothetical protein
VITPLGWTNAGAADFLRAKLATELRIDALFLFGSYRLFTFEGEAPTPTVESCILVAAKSAPPEGHKVRVIALEDVTAAPRDRAELLSEMARRVRGKAGRRGGIHVHDVPQTALLPEYPWPLKHAAGDIAARVVAHLQRGLVDRSLEPLQTSWKIFTGIETAADAYSKRIRKRLSADALRALEARGLRIGDPIMELPPGVGV